MNKKSFLSKVSMASAILVIAIVAGILAGCQKDMEDEMIGGIEVKKVDDSTNKIVRLKNSNENNGKILYATYIVSSTNLKEYIYLPGSNKIYDIDFTAANINGTSNAKVNFGYGWEYVSHNTGYDPVQWEAKTGSEGGSFAVHYLMGSPTKITIYVYY